MFNANNLEDKELLLLMERLFHHNAVRAYEVEAYDNMTVIFMDLDLDQQDKLINGEHSKQDKKIFSFLLKADNVVVLFLD